MKLFVNANILVDVALRRIGTDGKPLWLPSSLLLNDILKGRHKGYVSALSLYVVSVLVNPRDTEAGDLLARKKVEGFQSFLTVLDFSFNVVRSALREKRLRLEDAIQYLSAKEAAAEAMVTRNKRHFAPVKDEVRLVTPEELLGLRF
ncbi:MAG: type II toxin-antitoxin system VapC family toxin [Candidatus Bathyarchaeia archaeon]